MKSVPKLHPCIMCTLKLDLLSLVTRDGPLMHSLFKDAFHGPMEQLREFMHLVPKRARNLSFFFLDQMIRWACVARQGCFARWRHVERGWCDAVAAAGLWHL